MRQTGNRRARGEGGRSQPPTDRANLYDDVTRRMVAELEARRFPWVQPWDAGPNLPRNALTGRRYSGVNVLLLWAAGIEGAFPSASWLTFRQALEDGSANAIRAAGARTMRLLTHINGLLSAFGSGAADVVHRTQVTDS